MSSSAIGRYQTANQTRTLMTDARDVGFDSINIDNTHLMCNFALDVGEVERRFGNNFTSRRRSHMIRACS